MGQLEGLTIALVAKGNAWDVLSAGTVLIVP